MDMHQALTIAIDTMTVTIAKLESQARDWRTYGAALQFNTMESRRAAGHCDELAKVIVALNGLRDQLKAEGSPATARPGPRDL
jgi:hypothetical protein